MASIYELIQNMNPELNQKQMSLKDLIAANEQKKQDDLLAQQIQNQIQNSGMQQNQNIPQASNVMPSQTQPLAMSNNQNLSDKLGITIKDVLANQPKVTPEQEAMYTPPKPYDIIKDFGKYTKRGKGFWGKTGGVLADILNTLGTPSGLKLAGLLSYGAGGNLGLAKGLVDQGDIVAQRNALDKQQYDNYITNLRKTETEYDMKLLELFGKEAFNALKGGQELINFDPNTQMYFKYFLDENGQIQKKPFIPEKGGNYKVEKGLKDDINDYKTKQSIRTSEAVKRAGLLSPIQTQTAANTKKAQEEIELGFLPKKQELQNKASIALKEAFPGSEEIQREGLANGGLQSIDVIKNKTNDQVLSGLKLSKFTSGHSIDITTNPELKEVYNNLKNSIRNLLYLKTGKAATDAETQDSLRSYLSGYTDNKKDFFTRIDMLKRELNNFKRNPENKSISTPVDEKNQPTQINRFKVREVK